MMPTELAQEFVVQLTAPAVAQVRVLRQGDSNASKPLRLYVESGGCSGLQYGMTFDEQREGDLVADFAGVSVVVDSFSATYLRGTVMDFSDALTGGGFKITNPNAKQSCGCGKSFQTS